VRPRVLARLAAASAALAAGIALLPAPAVPARTGGAAASLAALQTGVLERLNLIRRRHGLVPLTPSAQLSAAAGQHTAEMLADGYFAHESADGSPFWKRIARFYPHIGSGYWSVGENLLWSGDALDAKEALSLWMASPGHRENILAPQYRQIGISACFSTDAPGDYAGLAVTVVDADFGVRR